MATTSGRPPSSLEAGAGGAAPKAALPPAALAVSLAVAAEMVSVSRSFFEENYKAWGVPHVTLGKRTVVPVEALRAWLESRTERAA